MSELMNAQSGQRDVRRQLLMTVSSLALLACVCIVQDANAEDADRPILWIELGADLNRVDSGQQAFTPPFVANNPNSTGFDPVSPAEAQRPPSVSFGEEGKLSFQPRDSNWIFSASILYGRANNNRHVHQTAKPGPVYERLRYCESAHHCITELPPHTYTPSVANFLDVSEKQSEMHAVLDFMAGKD